MNKFEKVDKYNYDFTERYFDLYWDPEDYLEDISGGKSLGK